MGARFYHIVLAILFSAVARADVVVQFGYGHFAETGTMLSLSAPEVSIRDDGRIIYRDDRGAWTAMIPVERVERLRRDLARDPFLEETRYVATKRPRPMPIHGGMSYIQFGEVVVATSGRPTRGPWMRVLERIRKEIPSSAVAFLPEAITVFTYQDTHPLRHTVEWPFQSVVPLASGTFTTSDRAIIAFVMREAYGRDAFRSLMQNGIPFSISILGAPGWMDDDRMLAATVEVLREDR